MQPASTDHARPFWQRALLVLIVILAALLVLALFRAHLAAAPPAFHATAYEPPDQAPRFTLTDHTGAPRSLADLRGSAVLLFFGYTHCPDVCPTTLQKLSRVVDGMDVDTTDLRILLVTVDPERDTPRVLADYVRRFGPFPIGLTGDSASLARMREDYGIYADEPVGDHHHGQAVDISHTPAVLGIDRSGDLRVLLPMDQPDEVVARDIELLLRG